MVDIPRIPDDIFRQLGSKRTRRIARDAEFLLMLARAPTIAERDRLAADFDRRYKRFKGHVLAQKQDLSRHGDVLRLPGLTQTIFDLNAAVRDPGCLLDAGQEPRFLAMARAIHELIALLCWAPVGAKRLDVVPLEGPGIETS